MDTVLPRTSPADLRDTIVEAVIKDVHGPAGGPEEELDASKHRPSQRYLVGKLAPIDQWVTPHESEGIGDKSCEESEDGTSDISSLPATTLLPSSIGLSFSVLPEVSELLVKVQFGTYFKTDSEVLTDEKSGHSLSVWKRIQHQTEIPVNLSDDGARRMDEFYSPIPELYLSVHSRLSGDKSCRVVSLFLVNGQQEESKSKRDEVSLFQPSLELRAKDGSEIFLERPKLKTRGRLSESYWNETRANAMRYRDQGEFAVGHGVSVSVERQNNKVTALRTSTVPRFEVAMQTEPEIDEAPRLKDLTLDMERLGAIPDGQFTQALVPLIEAYQAWIEEQHLRLSEPELKEYEEQAEAALDGCLRAVARLKAACRVLDENKDAAAAFRFANQAMARQRIRSIYAFKARRGERLSVEELEKPDNRSWRLFQLAFFLLNVPGLADPTHPERSDPEEGVADLLWYPTGGGKTEAYLGVAAFTMAIRRLQGRLEGFDGSCGVTVLMRYTLRLLTLQQFQRASALVCACEDLRREMFDKGDARWGSEPFLIGLWVGQKTTPNRTVDADEAIKQSRGGSWNRSVSGSPLQLTSCPWCGSAILPGKHVEVESYDKGRARTVIYCGDPMGDCLFSRRRSPGEGLPVVTVDEEIYRRLPSLLIATVDKFAQMPWRGETGMLFGRVSAWCPRHGFRSPDVKDSDSHPKKGALPSVKSQLLGPLRPPDLIIQDELHLISGPLGTLVGLFESGVDELCTWTYGSQRIRPKIIASTATVRQAAEQIEGVFARKVQIFPPPALDSENNFFARSRCVKKKPGRLYLGICAPGMNIKGTLIRIYSAFLSAAQQVYDRHGLAADPWMTLTGYFSSIRELGSMRRSCDDSVRSWVRNYQERGLATRYISTPEELTSRVSSGRIPELLELLEVPFDPQAETARKEAYKANRKAKTRKPIDILLATNMISVGVDVGRLGLMVVAGQPKNTAEYIQATSRVGRASPGIVCTVYNWARPRDLSHYEKFEHFHATFYQHVEALSVTSFSSRALDRGLTSLVTAVVRLLDLRYNGNPDAEKLQGDDLELKHLFEEIAKRAGRVGGERAEREVRAGVEKRLRAWQARIANLQDGARLGYREQRDGLTQGLLEQATGDVWTDWTVLNSLRNVEAQVGLILAGQENEESP